MAEAHHHLISAALLLLFVALFTSTEALDNVGWIQTNDVAWMRKASAEYMGGGDEFEMDSEVNRRILATTRYISYGALQANSVPCSRRGASYYNCRPGAQANPYTRSCSAITRCRS